MWSYGLRHFQGKTTLDLGATCEEARFDEKFQAFFNSFQKYFEIETLNTYKFQEREALELWNNSREMGELWNTFVGYVGL